MRDRIPIEKDLLPYKFDIVLAGTLFTVLAMYNGEGDFFTLSLYKDGTLVCGGEPVVYGYPLFGDVYQSGGQFPAVTVLPLDESGATDRVTYHSFSDTIYLCLDDVAAEGAGDEEQDI